MRGFSDRETLELPSSIWKTGVPITKGWTARLSVTIRRLRRKPEMTFGFSKSVACVRKRSPSHRPNRLEADLQSYLHHPLASRANERIAGREIRRQEGSAERNARTGGIAGIDKARCARGIGGDGMIEDVEDFPARLNAIALLEREVLEDRQVPVLEALVAEDVAAHVAERPECWRRNVRVAVYRDVAASRRKRGPHSTTRDGVVQASINLRRCGRRGDAAVYACNRTRHVAYNKSRVWCIYGAVRNAILAGREVGGTTEDVPAVRIFSGPTEIVRVVECLPWLRGGKGHDSVDLPAFEQLAIALDSGNIVGGSGS